VLDIHAGYNPRKDRIIATLEALELNRENLMSRNLCATVSPRFTKYSRPKHLVACVSPRSHFPLAPVCLQGVIHMNPTGYEIFLFDADIFSRFYDRIATSNCGSSGIRLCSRARSALLGRFQCSKTAKWIYSLYPNEKCRIVSADRRL
jgi:hypothetical protein